MSKKNNRITYMISAILFITGVILVSLNDAKLGIIGFAGYILCGLCVFAVLCAVTAGIVCRREKSNE